MSAYCKFLSAAFLIKMQNSRNKSYKFYGAINKKINFEEKHEIFLFNIQQSQ